MTPKPSNERLEIVELMGKLDVSSRDEKSIHRLVFACLDESNIRATPEASLLKDLATYFMAKRAQKISG